MPGSTGHSGGHGAAAKRQATFGGQLQNFVGMNVFKDSAALHRDAIRENPTLKPAAAQWDEDKEAEDEHKTIHDIPLSTPPADFLFRLGRGVVFYFDFIKWIWFLNLALSIISLIAVFPHLLEDKHSGSFPSMFYVAEFTDDTRGYWIASSVLSTILIFFLGPLYRRHVDHVLSRRYEDENSSEYVEDPFEGQYKSDMDGCVDKIEYDDKKVFGKHDLRNRRIISGFVFLCVLLLSGIVNFYLQRSANDTSDEGAATYIALTVAGINLVWKFLCQYLTTFERWTYWSDYRRWDLIKVFLFKVFNVLVLYFVKRLEITSESEDCPLKSMGDQFWSLLLVDIFFMAAVEVFGPMMYNCAVKSYAERSEEANEAAKPEFDLAEEYLEVVYRQFIVGLGLLVVPSLPWLALFGNFLEYWTDKYRMLRITQRPRRTNNTYKNVLMFFFFICGVAIVFSYPNGAIWVLPGSTAGYQRCLVHQ